MNKVGIDIIQIKRMKINENFLKKFLSINELKKINSFDNKKRKLEFAAGRWAIKEAIIKSTNKKIIANKIDIAYKSNGAPFIMNEGFELFNISISHEKKYSIAICINESDELND